MYSHTKTTRIIEYSEVYFLMFHRTKIYHNLSEQIFDWLSHVKCYYYPNKNKMFTGKFLNYLEKENLCI